MEEAVGCWGQSMGKESASVCNDAAEVVLADDECAVLSGLISSDGAAVHCLGAVCSPVVFLEAKRFHPGFRWRSR